MKKKGNRNNNARDEQTVRCLTEGTRYPTAAIPLGCTQLSRTQLPRNDSPCLSQPVDQRLDSQGTWPSAAEGGVPT